MPPEYDMPDLVGEAELARILGISETKLRARVEDGSFPRPASIAGRKVWSSRRVADHIWAAEAEAKGIPLMSAIKIPRAALNHKPLQAFQGPNAEQDAYLSGAYFAAILHGSEVGAKVMRQAGIAISGSMSTDTNSGGGFLVPEETQRAIINLRESRGVFPKFANTVPMTSDIQRIPRMLSDVSAAWGTEGGTLNDSDPTFGEGEMRAEKLSAFTKTSSELDEDSLIDLGDSLTTSMANAMAAKVDDAAFNGDGTSTYGGVLGLAHALDSAAIYDAATGNDSALTIDAADLEGCMGLCGEYDASDNRWYMHARVYYALCRLMSTAGSPTTMAIDGVLTPILMGYPVQFVQTMPSTTSTLASTIIAYFGDLRLGATYGVRRAIRTQISTQRYFETDQIAVKNTERLAIVIHERGESADNRPIVALRTAA